MSSESGWVARVNLGGDRGVGRVDRRGRDNRGRVIGGRVYGVVGVDDDVICYG